jgi:hypothetical protein
MPLFGSGFTPGYVPGYYLPGGAGVNFDFTTGILPAGITFTRASVGTYLNNGGFLVTAANDVARFNVVNGVRCLLIEPAATNLFTQSNAFDQAPWLLTNSATATPNQFVSPDSTNDGWLITPGTGNGGCSYPITFLNIPYTISIWAKLITVANPVNFLVTGTDSGPLAITATTTRLSFTVTTPSGPSTAIFYVNGTTGGNGFFGAQLEAGSVATSYISTAAATATRAPDSATFTIPLGITQLIYTFDDNTTQTVPVGPGSYTIPTNLNRPNIKTIASS